MGENGGRGNMHLTLMEEEHLFSICSKFSERNVLPRPENGKFYLPIAFYSRPVSNFHFEILLSLFNFFLKNILTPFL